MQLNERIAALRRLMAEQELDAYIVPSTDPHQCEYVAECWQRRAFISGFDGSAGTAVFTADKAGLWTDSRYFIQAEQQLGGSGIELFREGMPGVPDHRDWLRETLSPKARVGIDPEVVSDGDYRALDKAMKKGFIALHPVAADLVEVVWGALRPPLPSGQVRLHPEAYAGESAPDKLSRLAEHMVDLGADALLLGALDEIAWLFNLRGEDVAHNPVFIAYAVVERGRASLFAERGKFSEEVYHGLPDSVSVRPYESLEQHLRGLGKAGAVVWFDPSTVNSQAAAVVAVSCPGVVREPGIVSQWKSTKNAAEIAGMRNCHIRDGVSMVRFLSWLGDAVEAGGQTEITVAEKLGGLRAENDLFVGTSFSTISAYGANGAIVHYSATPESNAAVAPGNLLLVDSGGQYEDGTTDITRTVALGAPTEGQKRAYTAVLKGHLQLGGALFPEGTDGYQLDVLARCHLWNLGLNYGHGTGHGVGAALCVHEGPFSVSPRKNLTPLRPGNILSNEPGFYEAGGYGVRIENLVLVEEKKTTDSGTFLCFDELTLCPYDLNLVEESMLCRREVDQVNAYHAKVRETLSPLLGDADREWLERATRAL